MSLSERDIRNGAFIWYEGSTSTGPWSCPAVITMVSRTLRTFHVIALDDCNLQQRYDFDEEGGPDSRKTMRPITEARAREFMDAEEKVRETAIAFAEGQVQKDKNRLQHYRDRRRALGLAPRKNKKK
jgi:hypothetical protein